MVVLSELRSCIHSVFLFLFLLIREIDVVFEAKRFLVNVPCVISLGVLAGHRNFWVVKGIASILPELKCSIPKSDVVLHVSNFWDNPTSRISKSRGVRIVFIF